MCIQTSCICTPSWLLNRCSLRSSSSCKGIHISGIKVKTYDKLCFAANRSYKKYNIWVRYGATILANEKSGSTNRVTDSWKKSYIKALKLVKQKHEKRGSERTPSRVENALITNAKVDGNRKGWCVATENRQQKLSPDLVIDSTNYPKRTESMNS